MLWILVEIVTATLSHVAFTCAYPPGHSKLRSRWFLYFWGMYAFAYWPVRLELHRLDGRMPLLLTWLAAAGVALHAIGRARARRWSVEPREEFADDVTDVTVLDVGRIVQRAHVVR